MFHTAWTGPWNEAFLPDINSMLDSFLLTQDLSRSRFIFWLIDAPPDPSEEFVARYTSLGGGVIEFKYGNISELSQGTCATL